MSLDYPLYEEMVRRKSRAAPVWLIGDRLYYLGFFTAILSVMAGLALVERALSRVWYCGIAAIAGVAVFFLGAYLKHRSYLMAERDGIDPRQF